MVDKKEVSKVQIEDDMIYFQDKEETPNYYETAAPARCSLERVTQRSMCSPRPGSSLVMWQAKMRRRRSYRRSWISCTTQRNTVPSGRPCQRERFLWDRRVPVELPDLAGREAILRVHAKKVKMGDDVDFGAIARAAAGASGAELANMVNEAALRAVKMNRAYVTQEDMEESIETVIAGYQKKNKILSNKEKLTVSYHEVGHALVAALQTHSAPVTKITIVPRTSGALGYTMQVDEGERNLMSKEELENKIATLTGGRCAEELIFHSISTGASNDIEQATKLARAMVTKYGMSEEFGMVAFETETNAYLGGDSTLSCSPQTAKSIDDMVVAIVKNAYKNAEELLSANMDKLHKIAKYLYEQETITGEEFMKLLEEKEES